MDNTEIISHTENKINKKKILESFINKSTQTNQNIRYVNFTYLGTSNYNISQRYLKTYKIHQFT